MTKIYVEILVMNTNNLAIYYDHIGYLSNPNETQFQMVRMPFFNVEFVGKTSFESREWTTYCKRAIAKFAKLV